MLDPFTKGVCQHFFSNSYAKQTFTKYIQADVHQQTVDEFLLYQL